MDSHIETKFASFSSDLRLEGDAGIEGHASLFGLVDQGGDIVLPGAYGASLAEHGKAGTQVKMLWQHDPAVPIGVWTELREDARGLWVKGRFLTETQKGAEAAALVKAGAIEGLSIGYRTVKSRRDKNGNRLLEEVALWEVSLVTFPMLPAARIAAKSRQSGRAALRALAKGLRDAAAGLSPDLSRPDPIQTALNRAGLCLT